jgi:hypothetical protein
MKFSAMLTTPLSRPSYYAEKIFKTPSMRGYVQVTEVTEATAADADSAAFPTSPTAKRGQFRYVASPGEGMTKMQVCTAAGASPVWSPVARALKVTLSENDDYNDGDEDATPAYSFYAVVDLSGKYWWAYPSSVPFVFDPQLFGLVAQADDWDRVDSSAIEALTSTARW